MDIKVDPIEQTNEFKQAMKQIQPKLDALPQGISANAYSLAKKKLLRENGIEWSTPQELNPEVIFN